MNQDLTTLICLFHHPDQARAALEDILKAGIPEANVVSIGGQGSTIAASHSTLTELNVPEQDIAHLLEGMKDGAVVLSISAISSDADKVESIFARHHADKIDETLVEDDMSAEALPLAGAGPVAATDDGVRSIPIVEEDLQVGKREVGQGGVRVYRRVVEIPVEESVTLHEEHINVERRPVDRAVTEADLALQGERTIELTETAEEVVVGKTARVVEEVVVGKEVSEHTEHIHDTVRHTEVQVEEVAPSTTTRSQTL